MDLQTVLWNPGGHMDSLSKAFVQAIIMFKLASGFISERHFSSSSQFQMLACCCDTAESWGHYSTQAPKKTLSCGTGS